MAEPILPGSWIGVLGGGQLGRMFAVAAERLGYYVAVFDRELNCPASQVAQRHFGGEPADQDKSDQQLVDEMAGQCAVVTLEFENIAGSLVHSAANHTRTCPGAKFLKICQDRNLEKSSLQRIGCPTTPFRHVTNLQQASQAADQLGWPIILKTACSGYDGKGQISVANADDLPIAWENLKTDHAVAEKRIDFIAEVSMLAARNAAGQFVCYPLIENQHASHILDISCCPARGDLSKHQSQAQQICLAIAEAFEVAGLFCVEFFVTADGSLLINEMAPRPHNSGHLTIEAFDISQFEMQVRAICNLPLITPTLRSPAAMANLLGDVWKCGTPNWSELLRHPGAFLHLYGKSQPRTGRKMGHITVLDRDCQSAVEKSAALRARL
jgi:5-(carboxyamino)imidazole ribonucleotide synthase